MNPRVYVRVTKDDKNQIKYELMHHGVKLADVSYVDIVEMVTQMASCLRHR